MVDMTNRVYNDPEDFKLLGSQALFPCDTQYMVYNPMLRRYFLTPKGLLHYGIDAERKYISDNPNKERELIEKASKKVYDYIQYKAGRKCYEVQMYRIATAAKTIYPNQYFMRKQFEEALADQARFIVENSDSARYIKSEGIESKSIITNPQETWRDISDMSPETIRTLETLGLTRWFTVSQITMLDQEAF